MLGKLLKYDFRSMWKQFSVIWPAALILAFINRFTVFGIHNPGGSVFGEWMGVVSMGLFGGVCFTMVILSAVFVLTRFYKGLLGDEGYLMHTLPVRSWQLVLSKLICAVCVSIASMVIVFLACLLLFPINWGEVFRDDFFRALWKVITEEPDALLYLFEMCVMVALGLALCIAIAYLAMAVGHLFRRRIIMSVVAFIGLDILGSLYIDFVDELGIIDLIAQAGSHMELWAANLMIALPAAVMFLAVSYILKNRLNLE